MDKWDIVAIGFGIFIAFILGEVIIRLFFPQPENMFMPDPNIGSIHVPNGQFIQVKKEYFQVVKINSAGWRDSEHQVEKKNGTYRISEKKLNF